ncbi:hypothetical protein LCGC14_0990170 [marine sediment metagenome]|uniref:Uncharacterized protein n=1 Tax=marine sediment metagenome TaxID=412755 RepID=A0A0F9N5X2_9ZZZZ
MATSWMDIKQGKRPGAPPQTYYSKRALDHAVWYMNGLAKDFGSGRMTACDFQANYDMTQRLNMPIHCKKIGTDKSSRKPLYQCFKYPPLGKKPVEPLGLCKRKGGKRR